MFNYKFQVVSLACVAILATSCGGGETAEAPADEPSTTTASGSAPDLSQAGSVTGKVSFTGSAPDRVRIRMGAEPQCDEKHSGAAVYSEEVVVNENGTLNNVFVWVKSGLEQYQFEPSGEPAVLDQDGCVYEPHVFGVQTGQEVKVLNSDPVTHNIHPLPQQNREWNISQSPNQEIVRSFARPEVMIPVKCNIHPWMKSYIGVIPHPYFAVTGNDGTFELKDLPPGDYTIEAWHEKYGTQESQVTVGPKETREVEFSYGG